MTRRTVWIANLTLFTALVSCAPIKPGSYFFPFYEGGKNQVLRRDCCGGAGPEEVLTIKGPHKTRYVVLMRPDGEKIEGRVGVYIPKSVQVELDGREVLFKTEGAGQPYEHRISAVNETVLRSLNPKCLNVIDRLKADYRWEDLSKRFEGKEKKGTIIWFDISLPELTPKKFLLTLPGVIVNGERFMPLPIDFEFREPDTYIYPLNC